MKKALAQTYLSIEADCPHCNQVQDVYENVKESLGFDLRAENLDITVTCEECEKEFIVDEVQF